MSENIGVGGREKNDELFPEQEQQREISTYYRAERRRDMKERERERASAPEQEQQREI